jgi:hypothetical protein
MRPWLRCVAGGVAAVVGALRWYGLDLFVAQLALAAFLLVAGHAATTGWAAWTRPARWAIAATQVPFMASYGLAVAWYYSRQPITRPHGFPPLYLLWPAAALSALAWLTIWYAGRPGYPRRAVAYLAALALLVAANGVGVFAVAWRSTGGFGLLGEPTPWAALDGLAATSCLSTNTFHTSHGRTVDSKCPSGPHADPYAGDYDKDAFDNLLCTEQPRQAFQVWWDRSRTYRLAFTLDLGHDWTVTVDGKTISPPYPDHISGRRATIGLTMQLVSAFRIGTNDPLPIQADKSTETWNVQLKTTALGGWKVCRIVIPDPIRISAR